MPWCDQDSHSLQTVLLLAIFFCHKGRKDEVLPRIGHADPKGQLWYSSHIYFTLVLDSGRQCHAPAALPQAKRPSTHCTGDY